MYAWPKKLVWGCPMKYKRHWIIASAMMYFYACEASFVLIKKKKEGIR